MADREGQSPTKSGAIISTQTGYGMDDTYSLERDLRPRLLMLVRNREWRHKSLAHVGEWKNDISVLVAVHREFRVTNLHISILGACVWDNKLRARIG